MTTVYLTHGLAFFSLALATYLESRRKSVLLLGRQLPWLVAFAITQCFVEWTELAWLYVPEGPANRILTTVHLLAPTLAALLLIRFGIGLIAESGPLPRWLLLFPLVLITPAALIAAYALIVFLNEPDLTTASDIWTRYLLYAPASLLAAAGFWRQSREKPLVHSSNVRNMMYGAGLAFAAYALFNGLIVPVAPYGLAPWLNYDLVEKVTGVSIQVWRTAAALALTVFVVRALGIFEFDRKLQLELLSLQRKRVEETLRLSELRFEHVFEYAPIGLKIVSNDGRAIKANRTLQNVLGYSEEELQSRSFTEYTHADDLEKRLRLTEEVRQGKRDGFQMEQRYYRKDGSLALARVTISPVPDARGNRSLFITMVEDITRQRKVEEELRRQREQLQETRLRMQTEARKVAENWVNVLADIGRQIAHMESAKTVFLNIVTQARQLVEADILSLALFDDGTGCLGSKYQACPTHTRHIDWDLSISDPSLIGALLSGCSRRYPDDGSMAQVTWYCPTLSQKIQAAAVVPMRLDGQVLGGLWAARFLPNSFTPSQLFGLENLADQAVIALQHVQMAAQLQTVATLEERSRIAREMHDGLAQVLGYLGIQMQTIEAYTRQAKLEEALNEIAKTRDNIRMAQADVRENILSLRTTLAGQTGLVASLQEYVHEFSIQSETDARLVNGLSGVPMLYPLAEVQLIRIVQEALANVRKHAQAQRVDVELGHEEGGLLMSITDDGIGFEHNAEARRFGLQTMVERAQSVGGSLSVHSAPDCGTRVALWLPLMRE